MQENDNFAERIDTYITVEDVLHKWVRDTLKANNASYLSVYIFL